MFAAGQNVSRRWLSWRKQLKRKPRTTKHRSRKSGRGMPLPWKSSLNNLNRPKGWAEMNYRNALFCFWVLHKNVTVLGPSAHICRAELSLFVHDDCHNWTKCVSCECIEAPGFGVCEKPRLVLGRNTPRGQIMWELSAAHMLIWWKAVHSVRDEQSASKYGHCSISTEK